MPETYLFLLLDTSEQDQSQSLCHEVSAISKVNKSRLGWKRRKRKVWDGKQVVDHGAIQADSSSILAITYNRSFPRQPAVEVNNGVIVVCRVSTFDPCSIANEGRKHAVRKGKNVKTIISSQQQ